MSTSSQPLQPVHLSVVIPVYRDLETLSLICEKFASAIPQSVRYEILFVNDGNIGNAVYDALEMLRARPEVRVIHLSRNFGQHVAIAAAIKNACGEYILSMDSDLQYLPSECFEMYQWAAKHKYAAVISKIKHRRHSLFARVMAKIYYLFMELGLGAPFPTDLGSTFLISNHVAQGLNRLNDRHRMTIPMVYWLTGDIHYYDFNHQARAFGRSGYNFSKLVKRALDGITTFSARPLYVSLFLSFVTGVFSLLGIACLLVIRLFLGVNFLAGWLSTVFVVLVMGSIILFCLGILGLYVARIFEASLERPLYFVQDQSKNVKLFEEHDKI